MHASEDKDQVNTIQNTIVITYTQKKAKIMSKSIQNTKMICCMQKKVVIKSNTIENTMAITCMSKKAKIMSNSIQNIMMFIVHLHVEEGEYQAQHSPEHNDDLLHAEKG